MAKYTINKKDFEQEIRRIQGELLELNKKRNVYDNAGEYLRSAIDKLDWAVIQHCR